MKTELKTKRLKIMPMTDTEMQALIDGETDPHMRAAYGEMLAGAQAKPARRLWHVAWRIALRDGTPVGDLCFKGAPQNGAVEVGYGVLPQWQGQGYATEALQAALGWAFVQAGVFFVTAETEPGNGASQRVLQKAGFVPDGEGEEGPRFCREKPATGWMGIYLALGVGVGASLGVSSGNMALGAPIGMCIGVALGLSLDTAERKERARQREAYEAAKAARLKKA